MPGPPCSRCGKPIEGPSIAGPNGLEHASCPRGIPVGLLVAGVGCVSVAALFFFIVALLAVWQFLDPGAHLTPDAGVAPVASAEPLTQSFVTKNGLVTVRYPASFAASTPNDHVVLLQRNAPAGAQAVAIDAVPNPISDQLEELDRIVRVEAARLHTNYVEGPHAAATCHGEPGYASSATSNDDGIPYEHRACSFLKGGVFYRCTFAVPRADVAPVEPVLQEICASFELK